MSGPVPSPRINGSTGLSGIVSFPSLIETLPPAGGFKSLYAMDFTKFEVQHEKQSAGFIPYALSLQGQTRVGRGTGRTRTNPSPCAFSIVRGARPWDFVVWDFFGIWGFGIWKFSPSFLKKWK